jgi:large subunit ribosomal protein L31
MGGNDPAGAGVLGDVPIAGTLVRRSGSRPLTSRGDPAPLTRGEQLKPGIHPDYVETTVTCTCGNTFTTRSTAKNGSIHADVCSNCHPFYTGKQKILDTGGRVARFESRYGKKKADAK